MSKRMVDYKVEDGKIVSIDGYELAGSGGDYEIKELVVTENGVYDGELEAYKPVRVNVPQTAQGGSVKSLLDATQSARYLFKDYKGTSVDGLISYSDTSNVTNMSNMFQDCSRLTTIPQLDTSKVTTMYYMFRNCPKLTTIPVLDTSKVTDMNYMFQGCSKLTAIPALDASKVTKMDLVLFGCQSLTSVGMFGFRFSIDISSTALGHDALVAFLNQAGTAYDSSQKITMGANKLALLNDEEKAIAINKRWTLA